MNISNIVDNITKALDGINLPANILPPTLLKSTSLTRPGLSAYKITSQIIQNNGKIGIPTGENEDGSMNLINAHDYAVVKAIVDAIKNDAVAQIAVPSSSILFKGVGGNAGGEVTIVGRNILDSLARGIIQ